MDDIKLAASIVGAPCQDEIVWAILNAYQTFFLEDVAAFRITTKAAPELNVRYQTLRPNNPYKVAVDHGFLTPNGHPIYRLFDQVQALRPEAGYFIDLGVTHGFEKIWGYFVNPIDIKEVCALEAMPQSLKNRLDMFRHYGMQWVSCIGIDYYGMTVNPYFMKGTFPNNAEIAAQTVVDMGFERPSQEENEFNGEGFTIYPTFSWDSNAIERLSYAGAGPQDQVPVHWDPIFKPFIEGVPLRAPVRGFTFNTCYGLEVPHYYKLEGDYWGNVLDKCIVPLLQGAAKAMQQSVN